MASATPFAELFRNFVTTDEGLRVLLRTLENLPMGVILYEVSDPQVELVYLNRVARPIGVETPTDVIGRAPEDVFPGSGRDQAAWVLGTAREGKAVHISEYESGDERIWEADIYPIPGGGENLTFVLIMAIEVTTAVRERRRGELEREEQAALLRATAARMASLERVKSDFLNLASHELRGPLAVLRGYLAMLSDGSLGELPPQTRNILPILNAKAGQMAMLITQLLEAARLEDSRLQLKLEPVDLARLVTHAANTMGALVGPKHSIVRDIPSAEVLVVADPVRVETIIVNLLDNALKYSPEGGEVVVALGEVDGTARLAVHDRGMGIAGEDLPRLFTRFGRLVTADNSHIPGTGLGLYLSRELARMHGGDISVTSVLGEGSEFVLTLPKEGPQAESGNLAVAQGESGSGG